MCVFKIFWESSYSFFFFFFYEIICHSVVLVHGLITNNFIFFHSRIFTIWYENSQSCKCFSYLLSWIFIPPKFNADNQIIFKWAPCNTTYLKNVLNVGNEQILWSLSVQLYLLHALKILLVKDSGRLGQRMLMSLCWFQGIFMKVSSW